MGSSVQVVPPQACYKADPWRLALVAVSLADLKGPTVGTVELPFHLAWHPPSSFDLDRPCVPQLLYERVLVEARKADDLAFLNGEMLVALWPILFVPKGVRKAWEDQHPVLRDTSGAGAGERASGGDGQRLCAEMWSPAPRVGVPAADSELPHWSLHRLRALPRPAPRLP